MSFSEAPTTAIKGQRELLEWYSLPKEANGCEVWVPIPKRFSPLLGDTTILSTLGANLPQTLLVRVRVFWLTNLSYPIGNSPFFISSHSYHFPSHGLSWHLFWRSVVSRNNFKYSVHLPCHGEYHVSCLLIQKMCLLHLWYPLNMDEGESVHTVMYWSFFVSVGEIQYLRFIPDILCWNLGCIFPQKLWQFFSYIGL